MYKPSTKIDGYLYSTITKVHYKVVKQVDEWHGVLHVYLDEDISRGGVYGMWGGKENGDIDFLFLTDEEGNKLGPSVPRDMINNNQHETWKKLFTYAVPDIPEGLF